MCIQRMILYICDEYGKCSKILNTFLFLFSIKMLDVSWDGIQKQSDPKKQSDLGLLCLSWPFW